MRDQRRLEQLLQNLGAATRAPLERIQPRRDSTLSSSASEDSEILQKLALQRTGSSYYKDPNKQKRHLFRSDKQKAKLNDFTSWQFTKAERFAVLTQLIKQGGQDSLGQARAILKWDPQDKLNVNWTYIAREDGTDAAERKPNGWLDLVSERNDNRFVQLICESGASQDCKDQALVKALRRNARDAAEELLRYDADPNGGAVEFFHEAIADHKDIDMFLTARVGLDPHHINEALLASVGQGDPERMALLFAHGASGEFREGQALCDAVAGLHLEDVATILLHAAGALSTAILNKAVQEVPPDAHADVQRQLFELLLCAGADPNSQRVLDQLTAAVQKNQRLMAELLVRHGTSVDWNDGQALRLAVSSEQIDLVATLLKGNIGLNSTSRALREANKLENIEDFENIVNLLIEKGVSDDSLHRCLADTVEKGCGPSLVHTLIEIGANIDHADAECVRSTIRRNDFSMFRVLLRAKSSPAVLCTAIPAAMAVQPRSERYGVVNALLNKGVTGKHLHVALQKVARSNDDSMDYQLLSMLVRANASVDFHDQNGNCISLVTAKGDQKALDFLMEGNPSRDTTSTALGLLSRSFAELETDEYEKVVRMAQTLLERGAQGSSASQLLVEATRSDYRHNVFKLLLDHDTDANFGNGKALGEAIILEKTDHLIELCQRSKLTKSTFVAQLPIALDRRTFTLEKVAVLVEALSKYKYEGVLDQPLLDEIHSGGSRPEVIKLFLLHGASVDFRNGEALRIAVSEGDIQSTTLLLSSSPLASNVARAFPATMLITDLATRFALMQALLQNGGPRMGDEALIQAAREAGTEDLSHVELLLQHHASVDCQRGAPLLEAVAATNIPLIDLLLTASPNTETLNNAFNFSRSIDCPAEIRRDIFSRLLATGDHGFQTDVTLIETVRRLPTDVATSVLLLHYGASVDANEGQAMQIVSAAGSLELLKIFLERMPVQRSRDCAIKAASVLTLDETKYDIYSVLFETGISRHFVDSALYQATCQSTINKTLVNLIVSYNPLIDSHDGTALFNVAATGDEELLGILLRGEVTDMKTLSRSFVECMEFNGDRRRALIKQLLEKEPGVPVQVLSSFLAQVVAQQDHELLQLLAGYGPDAAYNDGESLVLAAETGDDKAVTILTTGGVSSPESFESKYSVQPVDSAIINKAFERMLDKGSIRSTPGGLHTASICLGLGIEQGLRDRALLDAFDDSIDQHTKDFVDLITTYEPNFSGDHGKVFVASASSDEVKLFQHMASQGPDLNIVWPALILAFGAMPPTREEEHGAANRKLHTDEKPLTNGKPVELEHVDEDADLNNVGSEAENKEQSYDMPNSTEERLVTYLHYLHERSLQESIELDDSVLFVGLRTFPEGTKLARYLLDHGCKTNSETIGDIDPSGQTLRYDVDYELEQMTSLLWALSCHEPTISEDVVMEILESASEQELTFTTSATRITATILAGALGRCTVLRRLIEIGVDVSACDIVEQSTSFHASRNGQLEAVEILHTAGAKVNDGSLQEAAREAHDEIVMYLLQNGHRADYPSPLHADGTFGRTALEELCLRSKPTDDTSAWEKQIHYCIELLLPTHIDDIFKSNGKTMLHFALENNDPVPIVGRMLEFTAVWENINHPKYLFKDSRGYYYSLTKYIEVYLADDDLETNQKLMSMLQAKKCEDRYYAHTVEQPLGAVGLPEDIALAVDKQKRADFEHSEAVKRQAALTMKRRQDEEEEFQRKMATDKQRHDELRKQHSERTEREAQAAQRRQAQARSEAQELQRQKQAAIKEENQLRQHAMDQEASRRQAIRQSDQASELAHRRNVTEQELAAMRSKLEMEEQMIRRRNQASESEASRARDLLRERRQTADYEAAKRAEMYHNSQY